VIGKSVERWLDSIRGASTEARNKEAQETSVNCRVSSIIADYSSDGKIVVKGGGVLLTRKGQRKQVNCRGQLDDSIGLRARRSQFDLQFRANVVLIGWEQSI
jgi:hypothetical protein